MVLGEVKRPEIRLHLGVQLQVILGTKLLLTLVLPVVRLSDGVKQLYPMKIWQALQEVLETTGVEETSELKIL
jgi:hypothetical protein